MMISSLEGYMGIPVGDKIPGKYHEGWQVSDSCGGTGCC
jgi:hypothetical protein